MKTHRITFSISPGGEMTSVVEGIDGAGCNDATAWVDDLGEMVRHEPTPDYYKKQVEAREQIRIGTGTSSDNGGSHGSPW